MTKKIEKTSPKKTATAKPTSASKATVAKVAKKPAAKVITYPSMGVIASKKRGMGAALPRGIVVDIGKDGKVRVTVPKQTEPALACSTVEALRSVLAWVGVKVTVAV